MVTGDTWRKKKKLVMDNRQVNKVDIIVGQNVKRHRLRAGLTQAELSAMIGVTTQQLHKYETAHNRITVVVLYNISLAIAVPISALFEFEGIEGKINKAADHMERVRGRLIRDFLTIDNEDHRHAILLLSKSYKKK